MKIYKTFTFSASHKLPGHPTCGKVHGHNYKVEVWVDGEIKDDGMVMDFHTIKRVKELLDHTDLNTVMPLPTVENICQKIKQMLGASKVRVWETDTCYAEE